MNKLIEKIQKNIFEKNLFKKRDKILICVSGGPDSVFLLNMLMALEKEFKLNLSIAHINHNLRTKESDKDELFVRKLSKIYNIPVYVQSVDTKKFAKTEKMSLEDAARKLRYDFFLKVCNENGIKRIITAHTKDDQAETILMRILRGAGIKGLCGISFKGDFCGKSLIRPLLEINKKDILKYLKVNKIKYRIDKSNLRTDFFRNKVRLKILPELEKNNPQLKNNLFNLSQNAKEIEAYIQNETAQIFKKITQREKKVIILNKNKYLKLESVLCKAILRKIIENLTGDLKSIDFKHIQILDDFIKGDIVCGKSIDLPRGIKAEKQRLNIIIRLAKHKKNKKIKKTYKLSLNKKVVIKELGVSLCAGIVAKRVNLKKHAKFIEYFDLAKMKFPLLIRTRQSGDRFYPLGLSGSKKLKKFFTDQKINDDQKDLIPLIVSGGKIAWVGGMRLSENFKVAKSTKKILKIQISKI
ncbi:MAG: tRNA lysidine(34) synthetase TilS [Candidatus Omnitrophota bacterium]